MVFGRTHRPAKGVDVQLYWRIFEDLKTIGETLHFNDPGLRRNFLAWIVRHARAIARAEGYTPGDRR
jgi:hypothetical protein